MGRYFFAKNKVKNDRTLAENFLSGAELNECLKIEDCFEGWWN